MEPQYLKTSGLLQSNFYRINYTIEIISLRFAYRKANKNLLFYGPFFNYFPGGILCYYLQQAIVVFRWKNFIFSTFYLAFLFIGVIFAE